MMTKLEIAVAAPCPFCGYFTRVQSRVAKSCASGRHYFVRCPSCHTEGPRSTLNEAEAIERWNRRAAIKSQPDAAAGWVSVTERLPEVGELVAVFTPWCENDWPGSVNIGLDCIDPNDDDHASWEAHNNHYEHYCCVAKGDDDCTGPSEKAPYTHWHALAAPPPVQAQGSDAA